METVSTVPALLNPAYWLNLRPVPLGPSLVGSILSFFMWFLVASLVLRLVARIQKKKAPHLRDLLLRFARPLSTAGILGLLCLFFAYEQIPLLGMRLWFLATALLFFWQIGKAAWFAVREYPVLVREDAERARLEKYLPHKKK